MVSGEFTLSIVIGVWAQASFMLSHSHQWPDPFGYSHRKIGSCCMNGIIMYHAPIMKFWEHRMRRVLITYVSWMVYPDYPIYFSERL